MSRSSSAPRPITAYCDRLTYEQGDEVQIMAAGRGLVDVDLVRLNHPPDDPAWPLPTFAATDAFPAQRIEVEPQDVYAGSYVIVEDVDAIETAPALSASVYVLPTRLSAGHTQALWSTMSIAGDRGLAVVLDENGDLAVLWGRGAGGLGRLVSPVRLVEGRWNLVSVSADESTGAIALVQRPVDAAPGGFGQWNGNHRDERLRVASEAVLTFGAARMRTSSTAERMPGTPSFETSFNGKIDSPVLLAASTALTELADLTPARAIAMSGQLIGAWDFSQGQSTTRVVDAGPHGYGGMSVNSPARAVTGVWWKGLEQNWTHAPEQYTAIHFHDDDLDDARWPVSTTVQLPDDLSSAVYAIRLREVDGSGVDLVPVIVVPKRTHEGDANALVLLPTYGYMAYANLLGNGDDIDYVATGLAAGDVVPHEGMQRLAEFREIGGSLYDIHSDGSGRFYSSPLRPILNNKPDWKSGRRDAYRHLAADLYILGWLDKLGIPYQLATDHVVNKRGHELLDKYDVVLTGTHPEYISGQIIDAVQHYLGHGGSLLYLGGNGFYWVTTESTTIPEMVEVRRGFSGTRTWTSAPGECHHSMTGELGGLWRNRGRSPNALVGVGFIAQGADGGAAAYRRSEASHTGEGAFLFDGVSAEVIGERGFDMGAAAGDEVDRFSVVRGSPPWGTVVASSLELSKYYKLAVEELQITRENTGGDYEKEVRADLVLVEQESGGLVFSTGSISWVQSMAIDYFENDVARVTENALRAALARRSQPGELRQAVESLSS